MPLYTASLVLGILLTGAGYAMMLPKLADQMKQMEQQMQQQIQQDMQKMQQELPTN
jgi:hypothetical protein